VDGFEAALEDFGAEGEVAGVGEGVCCGSGRDRGGAVVEGGEVEVRFQALIAAVVDVSGDERVAVDDGVNFRHGFFLEHFQFDPGAADGRRCGAGGTGFGGVAGAYWAVLGRV